MIFFKPLKQSIMKKQSFKLVTNKILRSFFLVSVFLLSFNAINAQVAKTDVINADVKYVGTKEEMLVFKVSYDNTPGDKVVVSLNDKKGNNLFTQSYSDTSFNKQFLVPKELEVDKLYFNIQNSKKDLSSTFEVSAKEQLIQDVIVTKIGLNKVHTIEFNFFL